MSILIKITLYLIRLFPEKLLIGTVYRVLMQTKYRKQVINNNYKSTIGSHLSRRELNRFYSKCIHNIAKIMVETLKFNNSRTTSVTFSGIDEMEKKCIENDGLILMTSHYGNWELACINLPLHTSIPCYGVYKPLKNKVLDKELIRLRSNFGLNLIPMNAVARSMAKNYSNSNPAIYILIADQNPRSIQNVIWTRFLGIMTAFSNGMIKFQEKYKFSIAYMNIEPGKKLYEYKINLIFPKENASNDSMNWYSACLEQQIKSAPHYWLWSHKRWKRKFKPDQ
jgi:KDO2-lipid IV(A) lauroyltransferase